MPVAVARRGDELHETGGALDYVLACLLMRVRNVSLRDCFAWKLSVHSGR